MCQNAMYSCDAKLNSASLLFTSLQRHMIFRNHFNMLICCSTNFWLLSTLKTVVLPNIFVETDAFYFILFISDEKKVQKISTFSVT